MRQNTEATQVSASQAFVEMYGTFSNDVDISADVADIWCRGIRDFNGLSTVDTIRFSSLIGQLFRVYQSAHIQWKQDALDKEIWTGFASSMNHTMALEGVKQCWETRKSWYGNVFQDWVDEQGNPTTAAEPRTTSARRCA